MIAIATFTYALGKDLGLESGAAEFQRQLADPNTDSLPCVRVIARLRNYEDVAIIHDAASTCIGKARSRAFHSAWKLDPEVLIFVDDDVEADAYTLGMLIEAVRGRNAIVLAPCITRGSNVVNVALQPDPEWRELESGGRTVRAVAGGFGLVAMSRESMRSMVRAHPGLHFVDDDGEVKPALFLEQLEPRSPNVDASNLWLGEDVSFCRRALFAGVSLEALATGNTVHAGALLRLEQVAALPTA